MPRKCTVCESESCEAIGLALQQGESYREIGERFAVSPDALYRHKQHLGDADADAPGPGEITTAVTVLEAYEELRRRVEAKEREVAEVDRAYAGAVLALVEGNGDDAEAMDTAMLSASSRTVMHDALALLTQRRNAAHLAVLQEAIGAAQEVLAQKQKVARAAKDAMDETYRVLQRFMNDHAHGYMGGTREEAVNARTELVMKQDRAIGVSTIAHRGVDVARNELKRLQDALKQAQEAYGGVR